MFKAFHGKNKAQHVHAGQDLQGQALQRPGLDCSLAEVQLQPSNETAAQESRLMLLSTGDGKLVLRGTACRQSMLSLCVLTFASDMQVLLHDRTAVGMGTTAHDVAAPDTSLPLLGKQAFMVEAAYQVSPGAPPLPEVDSQCRWPQHIPGRPL